MWVACYRTKPQRNFILLQVLGFHRQQYLLHQALDASDDVLIYLGRNSFSVTPRARISNRILSKCKSITHAERYRRGKGRSNECSFCQYRFPSKGSGDHESQHRNYIYDSGMNEVVVEYCMFCKLEAVPSLRYLLCLSYRS